MKFFRTLFFAEAPAKGALFGAVLIPAAWWCGNALFALTGGMDYCLGRVKSFPWQFLFPGAAAGLTVYAFVLLVRFFCKMPWRKVWPMWCGVLVLWAGSLVLMLPAWQKFYVSVFCRPPFLFDVRWNGDAWLFPPLPLLFYTGIAGYMASLVLFGKVCVQSSGEPFRKTAGCAARVTVIVWAASYFAGIGQMFYAGYRKDMARTAWEKYCGAPLTVNAWQARHPADAAAYDTWAGKMRKIQSFLKSDFQYKAVFFAPDGVFPEDVYAEWRKYFEEKPQFREAVTLAENMPEAPLNAGHDLEIQQLLAFPRLVTRWQIRFAVDRRDRAAAVTALEKRKNSAKRLVQFRSMWAAWYMLLEENLAANLICELCASKLLTDEDLILQKNDALQRSRDAEKLVADFVYSDSVRWPQTMRGLIPAAKNDRSLLDGYRWGWPFIGTWYLHVERGGYCRRMLEESIVRLTKRRKDAALRCAAVLDAELYRRRHNGALPEELPDWAIHSMTGEKMKFQTGKFKTFRPVFRDFPYPHPRSEFVERELFLIRDSNNTEPCSGETSWNDVFLMLDSGKGK